MKPIRKFLARHVWLLFLLIVSCFVGFIAFVVVFPKAFLFVLLGIGVGALFYACVGICFMTTYHFYMKWSLEE